MQLGTKGPDSGRFRRASSAIAPRYRLCEPPGIPLAELADDAAMGPSIALVSHSDQAFSFFHLVIELHRDARSPYLAGAQTLIVGAAILTLAKVGLGPP